MKDEYEGKDLEQAISQASADLGIPEAELHYEVLQQGRKGLLGLGMKNVRIRVMRPVEHLTDREILNGEEPLGVRVEAVAEAPPPAAGPADEGARSGRPRRRRRSGRSRKPETAAGGAEPGEAAQKPGEAKAAGSAEGASSGDEARSGRPRKRRRSRRGGRSRGSAQSARGGRAEQGSTDDADFPDLDDTPVEPLTGQPLEVQETLEKIFELSDLQIEVRPGVAETGMALRLGGADRKLLRQRNSELLLALQLLLNRMARRTWPDVGRIQLTTNGDDKSRDSKLVELTRGAAEEVAETGRTMKLRPMNAYERRLVHLTIREYSELTSCSDGSGAVKRVRISKVQNTLSV